MKPAFLTLVMALFCHLLMMSQTKVTPTNSSINGENAQGLMFKVQADEKDVEQALDKFLKSEHSITLSKSSFKKEKDLKEQMDVVIPAITAKAVDLFVKVNQQGDHSQVLLFVRVGTEGYVTKKSHPDEYAKTEAILEKFGVNFISVQISEELAEAQKEFEKATKEKEKVAKEIDDLNKDTEKRNDIITKAEKDIADAKAQIEQNGTDLETKNSELSEKEAELKEKEAAMNALQKKLDELR